MSADSTRFLDGATCLVDVFQRVAAEFPDRPCVVHGNEVLTYHEVWVAAERLAAGLVRAGVGRGDLVTLLVDRTAELPVAILAVLRAGAAYLPLDPDYPAERLRYIVSDARSRFVIGRAERMDLTDVIVVEPLPGTDGLGPVDTTTADIAYVIYTSGSTGHPKGCLVTHGNVLALLEATLPLFDVGADDRWSLFHSYSFDFSVWELWGAFATGGATVIVPRDTAQRPHDFLTFLSEHRITVLNQVPSVFRSLAATYLSGSPPPLAVRYLIFGGEAVDLAATHAFLSAMSTPPVAVNMYGITETTVHATAKFLTDADLTGVVRSPIGTPLPHLTISVRDDDLEPVPDGVVGEMWIAGAGVAAGYLRRPEMTRERFVSLDGRRHYRTGDLARVLPNGELEYLGRADQQVKLRGFRIELGEVEEAIRTHPLVRDVAATVTTTPAGAQFLVACVVPASECLLEDLAIALRQHTARILPDHMVPTRYASLAELPVTPSGKLDRATLPAMARKAHTGIRR
ncbi:amino acid adenylation domain-containing protein [Actinokineospora fastidiosa]|uniref:Amino acid adenylation domain-containing protein n=1 Tax=Actinokineospora fastidiosa TaxID=1816 RepID=A0A918GEN7_9PSEU|nr:amino acid adenylation domain-containing protein [Actinokineospora fastidiosa]GGS28828.1 hypothetical protein GCM10010171_22470 [Actinokineospora fastidiosa]